MEHPFFMYRAHLPTAERSRDEAEGEALLEPASAVTPSRTTVKGLGIAILLAAGAFVLTMLKNPPKSVASDPTVPVTKSLFEWA